MSESLFEAMFVFDAHSWAKFHAYLPPSFRFSAPPPCDLEGELPPLRLYTLPGVVPPPLERQRSLWETTRVDEIRAAIREIWKMSLKNGRLAEMIFCVFKSFESLEHAHESMKLGAKLVDKTLALAWSKY